MPLAELKWKSENPQQSSLLEMVAYAARVSNPSNQGNNATSEKLVGYLIKHKHWSPFEMVGACIEVNTTRDIARQLLRHRSFTFQEFSQRYADPTQSLSFTTRQARLQDHKNRQNSVFTNDQQLQTQWEVEQESLLSHVDQLYRWAIDRGIAKEQARAVLPEGLTNSRLYVNGTLRSWIHYIDLRSAPGTQLEHRQLAIACGRELEPHFPMIKDFIHADDLEISN